MYVGGFFWFIRSNALASLKFQTYSFAEYKMMNYIVFALALFSVQSVYSRSYGITGDMRTDDHQSYKLVNDPKYDVDQPTLIRKTRSGNCDSECSSDGDCAGSNTCGKCCWWVYYGNICTDPGSVISCISPGLKEEKENLGHIATAVGVIKTVHDVVVPLVAAAGG